jgi:hypothetical protein
MAKISHNALVITAGRTRTRKTTTITTTPARDLTILFRF